MAVAQQRLRIDAHDLYSSFRASLPRGDFDWTLAKDAEQFGVPTPPIVSLSRLVSDRAKGDLTARDQLGCYLRETAERAGACRVESSWQEDGRRFQSFMDHFVIEGDAVVNVNDLISFGSNGGSNVAARFLPEQLGTQVVLHCIAAVQANAADNFYICITDTESGADEMIRLGAGSLTVTRDTNTWEITGKVPRLFSLAVGGGVFSLYVNGALLWRRRRSGLQNPSGIEFKLLGATESAATDGVVFDYELWSLNCSFAGFDLEEPGRIAALATAYAEQRQAKPLYELLNAIDGLDSDVSESAVLDTMATVTQTLRGYPEWLIAGLERSLSPGGRNQWSRLAAELVPAPTVEVSNLTVQLSRNPATDVSIWRMLGRKSSEKFLVLNDVAFRLFPGDVFGIIGHNGAGKSTLLRCLAGLIPIKTGRIFVRGSHMLLRSGFGLRLELTGRENIISLGIYMGLSYKEIATKVNEIVEFAELGEHIDKPVKYYSDGMLSRLTFSTATSLTPEILMLDELLGAGDIKFQAKAQERLHRFIEKSHVVILVTHSVSFVRQYCNKALVLSRGRQIFFGDPQQAVSCYLNDLQLSEAAAQRAAAEPRL